MAGFGIADLPDGASLRPWPDDASAIVGDAVDFTLLYRGQLPARGNRKNKIKIKHAIRGEFHRQLITLVRYEPRLLHEADLLREADLVGGRIVPRDKDQPGPFCVTVAGIGFYPLVYRKRFLTCELAVDLLRRERPWDVDHGGDLDNRIKVIFDALRIPHHRDEIPSDASEKDMLCLLEDDALITTFSISTSPFLEAVNPSERQDAVDLRIRVSIRSQSGHWMGT
jgi:hypothetical protein